MPSTMTITDIQDQLVASADEVAGRLATKRAEKKVLEAEIRDLVSEQKKAERLAKVVRREIEKQAESDAAVASVTPVEDVAPALVG